MVSGKEVADHGEVRKVCGGVEKVQEEGAGSDPSRSRTSSRSAAVTGSRSLSKTLASNVS